jgi:hypothetical protein
MALPKMSKLDWYDDARRRAFVLEAIALIDTSLGRGDDVSAVWAQVVPLLERELEDGTFVDAETNAAWKSAMRRLHEARYGFAPTRATDAQLTHALSDIPAPRLLPLAALASEIAEYADGGTLAQIANLLVKEGKARGLAVSRSEARRIVAAIEGAPIPVR